MKQERNSLNGQISELLAEHQNELQGLSESKDALNLKKKLEINEEDVKNALKSGNTDKLQNAVKTIVNSEEGKRLLQELTRRYGRN